MELNTTYIGKYVGKSMCGFVHGHKYCIKLEKDVYGYLVSGIEDLTIEEDTTAFIRLSSEASVNRNFKLEKEENIKETL